MGRVLSGLSAGIFTGTATAAVVDLAPPGRQARASLVAALVNMVGLGSGPLLAGLLAQYAPAPTRLVFAVDLLLLAVGAVAVLALREPVRRSAVLHLAPRRLHVPAAARSVFVRAAIAGFAGFAVMGLFTAVSPAFLGDLLHHHSPALTGGVVAVLFAGSVLGQLLTTRVPFDRALPAGCVLLIVGMVLVGASLPTRSLTLLVIGALVAGRRAGHHVPRRARRGRRGHARGAARHRDVDVLRRALHRHLDPGDRRGRAREHGRAGARGHRVLGPGGTAGAGRAGAASTRRPSLSVTPPAAGPAACSARRWRTPRPGPGPTPTAPGARRPTASRASRRAASPAAPSPVAGRRASPRR